MAQSIGGGGGGGGTVSATVTGQDGTALSLAFGGTNGAAGNGAAVVVENHGQIVTGLQSTSNDDSSHAGHGILAQSIGGGSGSYTAALTLSAGGDGENPPVDAAIAIGAKGGAGAMRRRSR